MAIPNDPITREEQYLASMAGQEVDLPQPITRVEKYLAKASGMDVETPDPITREEKYLDAIAEGGGGGSSVTVEPLTVTENGTTTAPSGKAYSPVTVDVPGVTGLTLFSVYDANNPPTATLLSVARGHVRGALVLVAVNQDGVKYGFFEITADSKAIFKNGSGETITLDVMNRTIEGATSVTVYRATLVYPD